jgi:putative copper export protein/methionine-rich copper-binding protein CopC
MRVRTLFRALVPIVAALVVMVPATAFAHGALKHSVPAKGAHLATAPRELRLTFTEAPELAVTRIELVGPDSNPIPLDPLRALADSPQVIVARIAGPLKAGTYTVHWQIAGKDGHPVRDRFAFTIAPGAMGLGAIQDSLAHRAEHTDPITTPKSATAFDAESPLYVVVRWLTFTAILIIVGAVSFHYFPLGLLRRQWNPDASLLAEASRRAATIGWWAALALSVVVILRLFAQSYALHGRDEAASAELIATMISGTVWGRAWLLQFMSIAVAAIAFRAARRGRRTAWGVAGVATLALAFTPAFSGHAASVPKGTWLAVLGDTAHVIGAGGWVGSLLVLLAAGVPAALRLPEQERDSAVARLVNAFSPTALVFAGIAAATGTFAAWLHIGTMSGLWQSQYGRALLLKLAILSGAAVTGAYNWLRVKPTLGDAVATRRFRRSTQVELAIAVFVVAVTAVLVATPPPVD